MKNRKALNIIGMISGVTALLMLFIIPIIGIYFNSDFFNNKQDSLWYFILFLVLTSTANITLEKSNLTVDIDEIRDEKLKSILKSK
jgi:hypothetical protein